MGTSPLSIIKNPEFRTKCLVHISEFDGAKDARDELDILLDKCRVTHDMSGDFCWARPDEAALINMRGEGCRGAGTKIPVRTAICKITAINLTVLTIQ